MELAERRDDHDTDLLTYWLAGAPGNSPFVSRLSSLVSRLSSLVARRSSVALSVSLSLPSCLSSTSSLGACQSV
jgi:hypothetical protein